MDGLEFETETTFNEIEIGFVWAVLKAWWKGKPLIIKNPRTVATMTVQK